jgi:hypothetical protein
MLVIWGIREGKYFYRKDWTGSISLIRLDKFAARRARPKGGILAEIVIASEAKQSI